MKRPIRGVDIGFGLLLALLTLAAYEPALHAGLIWDDDAHVTKPALQSLHGLWRIWFEIGATQQYYPVLHSAFWFEHRLWGDHAFGYHLLNVGLHVGASLLFARLLFRLLERRRVSEGGAGCPQPAAGPSDRVRRVAAYFAAALFALHPVCVETVAWVSEQKNTLSAVFYLASALAYVRWSGICGRADSNRDKLKHLPLASPPASTPSHDPRGSLSWYLIASVLFLLALLSKSVTATLPAALLVITWWRKDRLEWRRDWIPLLPWFVLAGAMGSLTGHLERTQIGAEGPAFALSFAQRCVLAGRVFWFYLDKLIWPARLSFNYTRWTIDAHRPVQWLGIAAAGGFVAALWAIRSKTKAPLVAMLCYGGTLFPALGFFNVYPFIYSYVADHFQYLASLSVCALAGGIATSGRAWPAARPRLLAWISAVLSLSILAAFFALTRAQARIYQDATTLYQATLERNPDSALAWTNLGLIIYDRGDVPAAIEHYKRALAANPHMVEARNDYAIALSDLGLWNASIAQFAVALQDRNPFPQAEINLARPLIATGRYTEAEAVLRAALIYLPNEAAAHLSLARTLDSEGRFAEALQEYRIVQGLRPDLPGLWNFMGDTLVHLGRVDEAIPDFIKAIQLRPGYADAHFNYARALVTKGQIHEAVNHLIEAIRLDPDRPEVYRSIADLMRRSGHTAEAERFERLAAAAAARIAAKAAADHP